MKGYRFELFYWDYAAGIVLVSLALALTMGSLRPDPSSFLPNLRAADAANIAAAAFAGVIFNLANLLLVAGIELAGLAIAFPVAIGLALVEGVVLSYALSPKGNAGLLALGVAAAVVAVALDGKAYGQLTGARAGRRGILVCVASGLLMGLWAPFVTRALTTGRALGPYGIAVCFTSGAFVSCFLFNTYLMKRPIVGAPVGFGDFRRAPLRAHALGLLGGAIWGVGTVFNLVAASSVGVAVAYAIGQAAPMVAALWGVLAWREFVGAPRRARVYLALMFAFYCVAIAFVAAAHP